MYYVKSGCLSGVNETSITEDKLGKNFRTIATAANRRLVIFQENGHYCAEPSADVADNLASSFATTLQGSDASVSVRAEAAKTFASTVQQL